MGLTAAACAGTHALSALAQSLRLDTAGPLVRRALVFGNTSYRPARQAIPSSRKNATDVAAALTDLGFDVRSELDPSTQTMRASIRDFFGSLRSGSSSQRALA